MSSISVPYLEEMPTVYKTCPAKATWKEFQTNYTQVFSTTQLSNWYENGAHCVDNRVLLCLQDTVCYTCLGRWKPLWKIILNKCKAYRFHIKQLNETKFYSKQGGQSAGKKKSKSFVGIFSSLLNLVKVQKEHYMNVSNQKHI